MKLAIMQPYFMPYIGYFQLINSVDKFVIYDDIQFTKKGWINRNRILVNGSDTYISLPLKKDSDYLDVKDRYLADIWDKDRRKLINRLSSAYKKAPFYEDVFPILKQVIMNDEKNLFDFIFSSLKTLLGYLGIKTELVVSSTLDISRDLKSQDKVLEICRVMEADEYINPIGGLELYDKESFMESGVHLRFLSSLPIEYKQFNNEFIPWLSVIDVLMFNSLDRVETMLIADYKFV